MTLIHLIEEGIARYEAQSKRLVKALYHLDPVLDDQAINALMVANAYCTGAAEALRHVLATASEQ